MGESNRQKKFASLIQHEMAEVFQKETSHMFGKAFITITRVSMTPDLGIARIYLSFMLVDDKEAMMETIEDHNKELRHRLGQRVRKQVRVVPELQFYLDDGAEYAQKIDKLLGSLDIPPADDEDGEE